MVPDRGTNGPVARAGRGQTHGVFRDRIAGTGDRADGILTEEFERGEVSRGHDARMADG